MSEIVIYKDSNNQVELNVQLQGEAAWRTQKPMSELFVTTPQNITMHIKSMYSEGELVDSSTCKGFLQVYQD